MVIEYYWGAINTKDYTHDCATTGCDPTPTAKYWFVDASGTEWLKIQSFSFPAAFGLYSITFAQTDPTDGAILAGLTLSTAAIPEISTWAMMLLGLAGLGYAGHVRARRGRDGSVEAARPRDRGPPSLTDLRQSEKPSN